MLENKQLAFKGQAKNRRIKMLKLELSQAMEKLGQYEGIAKKQALEFEKAELTN